MIDDPPGKRNYWTAEYLGELPDDGVDAVLRLLGADAGVASRSRCSSRGAARSRATPSTRRWRTATPRWVLHPFCVWEGEARDEEHIAWGREGREVLRRCTTGATYLNFVGDEGADRVRAALRRALRPARRDQGRVGPGQRLPWQPEHRPGARDGLTDRRGAMVARIAPPGALRGAGG